MRLVSFWLVSSSFVIFHEINIHIHLPILPDTKKKIPSTKNPPPQKSQPHYSYPILFLVSAILAIFANGLMHLLCEGTTLYEEIHNEDADKSGETAGESVVKSWPLAPYIMMLNMLSDTAAMIPQMYMIKHSDDVAPPVATNFIGRMQ